VVRSSVLFFFFGPALLYPVHSPTDGLAINERPGGWRATKRTDALSSSAFRPWEAEGREM